MMAVSRLIMFIEFHINQEAIECITKVQGKIGLCCVAGLYRTGKSYLLNQILLGRSDGFGVGPTINPCTKGLWIWSEPIQGTTPDGENINVLIIDTEGLGAFDESQNHDVRIFTLAILLSSFFIYNSMGAIDENSLNQLSLVVNLTKNIQLKQQACDEVDPEEYQEIFPSFMWIVRDFALQLTDENNHRINQKDYLERALQEQKGFSDGVAQKNRIRRLLKSFFKDRDCCTLVRPIAKESELQDLANIQQSDLRQEFQDQIKIVRKKILNKIRPKCLKNRQLTAIQIVHLATQYVNAINQGAVPNIESAWTYLCQFECQKALLEASKLFCQVIKDNIKIPCGEHELQQTFIEAESQAKQIYQQIAFGKQSSELKRKLKEVINQSKDKITEQNKIEGARHANEFLQESYQQIEHMINQNQFETFQSFKLALKDFQHHCEQNAPHVAHKKEIVNDFCSQALEQGADFFQRAWTQEIVVIKALSNERIKNLETQIDQINAAAQEDRKIIADQLAQGEQQKAELLTQNLVISKSLETLKEQKQQEEMRLNQNHTDERNKLLDQIKLQRQEIDQQREALSLAQRSMLQTQLELDKQSALFNQKVDFLDQQIQAKDLLISQQTQDIRQIQLQFTSDLKDLTQSNEKKLSEQNQKLEDYSDKISELHQLNQNFQQSLTALQQSKTELETSLRDKINKLICQLNQGQEKLNSTTQDFNRRIVEMEQQQTAAVENERIQKEQIAQQTQSRVNELDREVAIASQKLQFAQLQLSESVQQYQDAKIGYESTITNLQSKVAQAQSQKDQLQQSITEIKREFSAEKDQIKIELQSKIDKLNQDIEELQDQKNQSDMESKMEIYNITKDLENATQNLNHSEQSYKNLDQQLRSVELKRDQLFEDQKQKYHLTIQNLESELEKVNQLKDLETRNLQIQAEQQLNQLKQVYDVERQRLETRINEDATKYQQNLISMQSEYETRIRDEQYLREEDVEMLQSELQDLENRHQTTIKQLEQDNSLMAHRIQSLEQHQKEYEARTLREQQFNQQQIESAADRSQQERKEIALRLEQAQKSATLADQQLSNWKMQCQQLTTEVQKLQQSTDEQKAIWEENKSQLLLAVEELKQKNQQISDQQLQQKLESSRDTALDKQRLEFQERKIEELNKQTIKIVNQYEERLKLSRAELQADFQEQLLRLTQSKQMSESKNEAKRKALKQREAQLQIQLLEKQREQACFDQLMEDEKNKNQEVFMKLENENQKLQMQLQQVYSQIQETRENLTVELDKVKYLYNEAERNNQELQKNSERDRALLEGKVQFLEQQRDQAKMDYQEASHKFEAALESLQKQESKDNSSLQVQQLEAKIKNQSQDWLEEKQKLIQQYDGQITKLQNQNIQINTQLQLLERDKLSQIKQSQNRIEELNAKYQQLKQEYDAVRSDMDLNSSNKLKQIERDRELQKQKIKEIETKANEAEIRRNALMFDFERERARWSQERDQMSNKITQYVETITSLERTKENIMIECEKLKNLHRTSLLQNQKSGAKSSRYGPTTPKGTDKNFTIFAKGFSDVESENQVTLRVDKKEEFKQEIKPKMVFNLTRTKERLGNITNLKRNED